MKKTLLTAAIALTGLAAFSSAQAQSIYTPGDSYLFFLAQSGTGSGKNVQIDLGDLTSSSFTSFNFSASALSSILGTTYGSNWYSLNTVSWGLIGSANINGVDAATAPALGVTMGVTGANYSSQTYDVNSLYTIGSTLDPMNNAGSMVTATQSTILDNNGVSHYYSIYDNLISGSASLQDANGFGGLSGPLSGAVTTYNNNVIRFYSVADDGSGTPVASTVTQTGSFAQNGAGAISVSAVPEPSTYVLFGLGALALMIVYRRHTNA